MLSDHQTRVFEALNARVGDLIVAARQLTEAVRQVPTLPTVPTRPPEAADKAAAAHAAWDKADATLHCLQALEQAQIAFGRASTDDLAESPPIRALYAQQLRVLHQQLHGLRGTPVEGYIAEDA